MRVLSFARNIWEEELEKQFGFFEADFFGVGAICL
jgi:hypothetical protein